MSVSAGIAALLGGLGIGGDLLGSVGSYFSNKKLQELDQEFNANQAEIARDWQANENVLSRDWQSKENQIARDWQTNANALAMDFNAKQAQAQRAWEEHMSSTSMQRQVADLEKAGLNPILAVSQLGGASFPAGATASGFASAPSGSSSPSFSPNTTARGNSAHANIDFNSVARFVGDFLSSAHKISMQADKFQHEREQLERKQDYQKGSVGQSKSDYVKHRENLVKNMKKID